jgi:hypothetical protein
MLGDLANARSLDFARDDRAGNRGGIISELGWASGVQRSFVGRPALQDDGVGRVAGSGVILGVNGGGQECPPHTSFVLT